MTLFFVLSLVLKIGPRVLYLLGKNSTTKPLPQTSFLSVFLKTESYNVTQAGFELPVILPLPVECWNCRHTTFCFRGCAFCSQLLAFDSLYCFYLWWEMGLTASSSNFPSAVPACSIFLEKWACTHFYLTVSPSLLSMTLDTIPLLQSLALEGST